MFTLWSNTNVLLILYILKLPEVEKSQRIVKTHAHSLDQITHFISMVGCDGSSPLVSLFPDRISWNMATGKYTLINSYHSNHFTSNIGQMCIIKTVPDRVFTFSMLKAVEMIVRKQTIFMFDFQTHNRNTNNNHEIHSI